MSIYEVTIAFEFEPLTMKTEKVTVVAWSSILAGREVAQQYKQYKKVKILRIEDLGH